MPRLARKGLAPTATPAAPKTKYLVNRDAPNRLMPYNEGAHKSNPKLIVVHGLPSGYVQRQADIATKRVARLAASATYLDAYKAKQEAKFAEQRERLEQARELKITAASEAVQAAIDTEMNPKAFVIGEATADELVTFAKDHLGVDLNPDGEIEAMRAEVATLAGVTAD
jgi:hypothetical protein